MSFVTLFVVMLSIGLLYWIWSRWRKLAHAEFIRSYMFPLGLLEKFAKQQPQLALKDKHLVARALRQFFLAHLKSGRKFVSMPSQVVDDLWHEFILYTREYQQFCKKAFGQFLHHIPAVVLSANRQDNTGLRRVWWYACLEENINPRKPTRLPLLFAIDSKLYITNGFTYALDCSKYRKEHPATTYCGGDFSSSSFDGSTDGFGDSVFSSSDGGGDSGGGGCGGGCGGGD